MVSVPVRRAPVVVSVSSIGNSAIGVDPANYRQILASSEAPTSALEVQKKMIS